MGRGTSWLGSACACLQIKVVTPHRQMSARALCLYHYLYVVLIPLKHKNFCQVTKMNMQDRHWRVITFRDIIYPWCLQEMNLHIKYTLFLCLNLFNTYGFSKQELPSFVVWFPQIVYFPFLNLREQTLEKSVSWCNCSESLLEMLHFWWFLVPCS